MAGIQDTNINGQIINKHKFTKLEAHWVMMFAIVTCICTDAIH